MRAATSRRCKPRGQRGGGAFTLIEVMAVVVLTALVLGVALDYYYDLSRASQRATERTRVVRRASALLDRIASDLEGAALVQKPAEEDRLSHPWVFLGENHGVSEGGSDRFKFITRNHIPRRRSQSRHESNISVVAYTLERDEKRELSLRRWSSPGLPDGLDRNFPDPEDALLLGKDLDFFSVRFLDNTGSWVEQWDSSQLVQADELPVAVQVELALADFPPDAPSFEEGFPEATADRFRRTVVLPVRPLDLETLTDPQGPYGTGRDLGAEEEGEFDEEEFGEGGPEQSSARGTEDGEFPNEEEMEALR